MRIKSSFDVSSQSKCRSHYSLCCPFLSALVTERNILETVLFSFFSSLYFLSALKMIIKVIHFTLHFHLQPQCIWISYTFHTISLHGKVGTQQIDLAPNVWLYSPADRASHQCRGGHGFESRWSPDIFQPSCFQMLKLDNLLRWSLLTFIYNRSTYEFYVHFTENSTAHVLGHEYILGPCQNSF